MASVGAASDASSRPGLALAQAVAQRDADGIRALMSQWGSALRRSETGQLSGQENEGLNGFMDDFLQAGGVKLLLKELEESCSPRTAADMQAAVNGVASASSNARAARQRRGNGEAAAAPTPPAATQGHSSPSRAASHGHSAHRSAQTGAETAAAAPPTGSQRSGRSASPGGPGTTAAAAQPARLNRSATAPAEPPAGTPGSGGGEQRSPRSGSPGLGSPAASPPQSPSPSRGQRTASEGASPARATPAPDAKATPSDERGSPRLRGGATAATAAPAATSAPPPASRRLSRAGSAFAEDEVWPAKADERPITAKPKAVSRGGSMTSMPSQDRLGSPRSPLPRASVGATVIDKARRYPQLVQLSGLWMNTEGLVCHVSNTDCTFTGKGTFQISVTDGAPVLNNWVAVEASDRTVKWERGDKKMEWQRIYDLAKLEAIQGLWGDSQERFVFVAGGACRSLNSGWSPNLSIDSSALVLDDWAVTSITAQKVMWCRGGETLEWYRVRQADQLTFLDGGWKNSDGLSCTVEAPKCVFHRMFGRKETVTLLVQDGTVVLNGWKAIAFSANSVNWQKNGKSMSWQRTAPAKQMAVVKSGSEVGSRASASSSPAPPPAAAEAPAPAPAPAQLPLAVSSAPPTLSVLNGMWKNSEGLICTVLDGKCTFVSRGSLPIVLQDGVPALNGWRAMSVAPTSVSWRKGAQTMEWSRITEVAEVEDIQGLWRDPSGVAYAVSDGACLSLAGTGAASLGFREGLLTFNDWVSSAVTDKKWLWQRGSEKMEWRRLQEAGDLGFLDGTWTNTDGLTCVVAGGKCAFNGREGHSEAVQIAIQGGDILLNGWKAVGMTLTSITWQKAGKSMGWERVEGKPPEAQADTAPAGQAEPTAQAKKLARGASTHRLAKEAEEARAAQKAAREALLKNVEETSQLSQLQALNGVWKNSEGLICTVFESKCTFVVKGSYPITFVDGAPNLNGWRASKVAGKTIQWEKGNQTTEWRRLTTVDELQGLSGTWRSGGGSVYTVSEDKCTSPSRSGVGTLTFRDGLLSFNGWAAASLTMKQLAWRRGDEIAEWTRLEEGRPVDFLDGRWKNTDGLVCDVAGPKCTFKSNQVLECTIQEGFVMLNGWKALQTSDSSVVWQKGNRSMSWERLAYRDDKAPAEVPRMEDWGSQRRRGGGRSQAGATETPSEPDSEPRSRDQDAGDGQTRAANALVDAMKAEPRLAHWLASTEVSQLQLQLSALLSEGSGWRTVQSKRSTLKACFGELAEVLADSLRGPLVVPLGEDVLGSAIETLLVGTSTEDERITHFRRRLKAAAAGELVSGSPRSSPRTGTGRGETPRSSAAAPPSQPAGRG